LFDWGYNRSLFDVWQLDNNDNTGAKFWKDLFDDATFRCYLSKRWIELTAPNMQLNYTTISNQIDQYAALLSESQVREQTCWGTVGSQLTNIAEMKTWIQNRISWINNNMGSAANCSNVDVPNLVISKIHYNPLAEDGYSSNNLEFIEITNNSNQNVNVTGYYIRELGISYQFPANATINANQKIYLCSNTDAFTDFYGVTPFGQFTRNLRNSSYNIVLSDAFGNTIDQVNYQDNDPWPVIADGTGYYLQLVDLSSDNSLAINWTTSGQQSLSTEKSIFSDQRFVVYPNPTSGVITVKSNKLDGKDLSLTIYNLFGQIVGSYKLTQENIQIDLSNNNSGLYYYSIISNQKIISNGKIIKR